MKKTYKVIQTVGDGMVDFFHYLALLGIGVTIIWSAVHEYMGIIAAGRADLKDILLLFIYLELGSMVGIYFKTRRLPVQFLIYIAITALSRHLVIDVQAVTDSFHLYLLLTITCSIVLLSIAIMLLSMTARKFGRPDDTAFDQHELKNVKEFSTSEADE